MKTPMQELLEEVIAEREGSTNVEFRAALDFVKSAIEQDYVEKEKEQIMDANVAGMEFIPVDPNRYQEDAQLYYNETYGGKDEL